jgi:hypothetical protein
MKRGFKLGDTTAEGQKHNSLAEFLRSEHIRCTSSGFAWVVGNAYWSPKSYLDERPIFAIYRVLRKQQDTMVERKSVLRRAPDRPELDAVLEKARTVILTDAEVQEQLASFVYGNAPKGSRITKESARRAASRVRVFAIA